jgi:hypothetical protein
LDAETSGDERLVAFLREAQATHRQLAEQAKELLGIGDDTALEASGVPPRTAETWSEGEIPSVTVASSEGIAPPEEAVPRDVPSPPDEERPPLV